MPPVYRAANAIVILVISNISLKFPDISLSALGCLIGSSFYHADDPLRSSLSLE